MKNDDKMKPDSKRGFPGILLLFIVGLIVLLAFQNISDSKVANVSFSHQLEHLVNLDLLDPTQNKKTALNDSLVTFHGMFRENLTEVGKERYRYLSLLFMHYEFLGQRGLLSQELSEIQAKVYSSSRLLLQVIGMKLSDRGYEVIPKGLDSPDRSNAVMIKPEESKLWSGPSFFEIKRELENTSPTDRGSLSRIESSLLAVVQELRSSEIGIGNESMKRVLREAQAGLEKISSSEYSFSEKHAGLSRVVAQVSGLISELTTTHEGVKFYELRSVRSYLESIEKYNGLIGDAEKNTAQLDKARQKVANVVWFFNDREISTKALEKKSAEEYGQWFAQSEKEWSAFQENKGLAFKAPDQPRNLLLEKTFKSEEPAPNYLNYIFTFLPIVLVAVLLYFIFSRQMKGGASSAMNFGKSPAKMITKGSQRVTFDDVAGIDEAKEELEELVECLKDPKKFTSLGARIPKGVLLVGAPGTGKTLVAKAVAGEAGVPFFSISGSDFVEMFVGVGASRVRDLFDQARKNSPCIIFIDEIDAVGRHRGSGLGGGHDEREQTLNQLLVEIDGMDSSEGVIIIAATNRPDVLDKALLRPGRFDRSVHVDLPDLAGRLAILKVHSKSIKIDEAVDLKSVARATQGLAGADLANIINEAALLAARKMRAAVTQQDFVYAQEKVQFGKERRSLKMELDDIKTTAYHEAGHALLALHLNYSYQVTKVTRTPRGRSLGATYFELKTNRVNYRKRELETQLIVLMGGRVAEILFNEDSSSGAQMDIKQATHIARSMVCEWGMSEKVGMISYSEDNQQNLMAGFQEREYSEETALTIDKEIKGLLDKAYQSAYDLLSSNKEKLILIADALMEFETLEREDLEAIMNGTWKPSDKQAMLDAFNNTKGRLPPPPPQKLQKKKRGFIDKPLPQS
jgi:cell division protease FtsH